MTQPMGVNRRTMLQVAGASLCAAAVGGCEGGAAAGGRTPGALAFNNADFYKADGAFDVDAAKQACIDVMKYHGYPLYPNMKEELWASDYGTGRFTELGLAARMWKNHEAHYYMLMDLFLLPNQMLPEHWHLKPEKGPVKLEGWLVRYGQSHIVGEGEPNLGPSVVIPTCHMNGTVTVKHEVVAGPGDFVSLNRAEAHHWQLAGPQGAIMSEVANMHNDGAVRHLDPALNKHFLGG